MNHEQAMLELQDNLRRLAEIARTQTKILESHAQTLLLQDELDRQHSQTLIAHEAMLRGHAEVIASHEKYQRMIERNWGEIAEKLNTLLGHMMGRSGV